MPLSDMRAFFRWLDEAGEDELAKRHEALSAFVNVHQGKEIVAEAARLLRYVEEEMLARNFKV